MGPILEEAEIGITGNMGAILVGSIKILLYFVISHIVRKSGRKLLMLISASLSSISLFLLGSYFFMKEMEYEFYKTHSWFPILVMLFFVFAYSLGLGFIPLATVSETFRYKYQIHSCGYCNVHRQNVWYYYIVTISYSG